MKKPELLVSVRRFEDVIPLIEAGADALSVGDERYGLRNAGNFTVEQIDETIKLAHERGVKVYVNVNSLLHNEELDALDDYLKHLEQVGADAIVFGDPSVLATAKDVALGLKLHWSMEMLSTSFDTANYWASKGAKRAVLARELTIDETIENRDNTEIEVEAQVHGATCIFQSRRDLVSAYFGHQGKDMEAEDTGMERSMFLKEEKRRNITYPVYEDAHGTHIFSAEDICMVDGLADFVTGNIDSIKIEGLLHTSEYIIAVTKIYREALDLCVSDMDAYYDKAADFLAEIEAIQPKNRPLNTGFYYKPPIPYMT
ncbi:peptidase U32 family protein [Brevibacillus dissolubilis]|uniref:peptidase U32 family protein n=1 Tax=Brevibacillus dissolubilis TaxID=1844116 RepID=UPI0011161683|nr:peptidase U32 family protein [Brevibacillus dissolubilis]